MNEHNFELSRGLNFVSENDPDYLRFMQEKKAAAKPRIFGYKLRDITGVEERRQYVYSLDPKLKRAASIGPQGQSEVRYFFGELLKDADIRNSKIVQTLTDGMPGALGASAKLMDAFMEEQIPLELFEKMIMVHGDQEAAAQERLNAEVQKMKQEYIAQINKLIDNPNHPLQREMIPEERLLRRLDEPAVIKLDALETMSSNRYENSYTAGDYNANDNSMSFLFDTPSYTKGRRRYHNEIYNHEATHAIAGRAIVTSPYTTYNHIRSGLRTTYEEMWLNEAITESLAQDIILSQRQYERGSYLMPRKYYKEMIDQIPESLFLWAYFENASGGAKEPGEHRQRLLDAIQSTFGADYIVEVHSKLVAAKQIG